MLPGLSGASPPLVLPGPDPAPPPVRGPTLATMPTPDERADRVARLYLDAITGLQDIDDEDEAAPIVESTIGQIMASGVEVTLSSVGGVTIDITAAVGGPLMLIQSLLTALADAREVDQETLIFELREELNKHRQGDC